jgi:deoxyribose-phosphate aldolase
LDAAVLRPEFTRDEAREAVENCLFYETRTVCVRPADVELAVEMCAGSGTQVCVVLSFPHGTSLPETKQEEARSLIDKGADEIDMVVNYGHIRSGLWELVADDIEGVVHVAKPAGKILKVILETCHLNKEMIVRATDVAANVGADFVKTSTGFATGGATPEAVKAMVEAARERIHVKASGGIRDQQTALEYIHMGCTRLGTNFTANRTIIEGNPATEREAGY